MRNFRVLVNGNEYRVAIEEIDDRAESTPQISAPATPAPAVKAQPKEAEKAPVQAHTQKETTAGGEGNIYAAMPGTITSINVQAGDSVQRGQALLVLEAMKMENDIMAPADGVVKAIHTSTGASVNSGDLLMVLE